MNLAWLGLGQMGAPMAARLVDAGHGVTVWNRSPERTAPLVERGAQAAVTPREAASKAEVVFTMVADPAALEAVVFGDDGVSTALGPGTVLVDMSTVGRAAIRSLAARLPEGVEVLDAPVLGSVAQAEEGSLKVFAGGDAGAFERVRPLLDALGEPRHMGPSGSGAAMKLVANSTLGALMSALAEALALADGLGLEEQAVLDVLAESPIGVTARGKRSRIESGEYPPNFKLSLAAKDLALVEEAAAAAGVPARVSAAARAHFDAAHEAGLGPHDYSAVVAHVRNRPVADRDDAR